MIKVTIVVENSTDKEKLYSEHGLSYWIETPQSRILFDTGQGRNLYNNADTLSIDLSLADALVFSHGHYDHTGGLHDFLEVNTKARLHFHPDARLPKYSQSSDKTLRNVGLSEFHQDCLDAIPNRIHCNQSIEEIAPSIFLTGEIPRRTDYETVGGDFFRDKAGTIKDSLPDDQSIFFDTPNGIVVLAGCAHAGIVNILTFIQDHTDRPIFSVIGGLHLLHASQDRIAKTIAFFKEKNIQQIAPVHCTGFWPQVEFANAFPHAFIKAGTGSKFVFEAKP
jgi:7,8-dihydropterin-6-yl-methyl-4-(beta-D-ribofuranosyl)aminobenzene 5'-phosphate synthase